jgi:RNA polymerase sigma-70 factor (ECF subfamily)
MTHDDRTKFSQWADYELVNSLIQRDGDAFTELFRRHSGSVGEVARVILGESARSDDVVAEVFLALWIAPERPDLQRGSLLGYLRMTARARSIDIVRSEVARNRREQAEAVTLSRRHAEIDVNLDDIAELREVLASLPITEREPVELAFTRGMTYREIATYLHIPEGTAKGRIRAGLRHMRQAIEAQVQLGAMEDV